MNATRSSEATAADVRAAVVIVAHAVVGDEAARDETLAEAVADGRLPQIARLLRLLWFADSDPGVRAVLLDPRHLRVVAARLALAEARGQALPPPGWLLPAA